MSHRSEVQNSASSTSEIRTAPKMSDQRCGRQLRPREGDSASMSSNLERRMIYHVYYQNGIKKALRLNFWEKFLITNPDIPLNAYELRKHFYHQIVCEKRYFQGIRKAMVQYIAPAHNYYPAEALEAVDVAEGKDFSFNLTSAGEMSSALQLQTGNNTPEQDKTAGAVQYITKMLRELVTNVSGSAAGTQLTRQQCMTRIADLTRNGVRLIDHIGPTTRNHEFVRKFLPFEPSASKASDLDTVSVESVPMFGNSSCSSMEGSVAKYPRLNSSSGSAASVPLRPNERVPKMNLQRVTKISYNL